MGLNGDIKKKIPTSLKKAWIFAYLSTLPKRGGWQIMSLGRDKAFKSGFSETT